MKNRYITDEALIDDALDEKPDKWARLRQLTDNMSEKSAKLYEFACSYKENNDIREADQKRRGIKRIKLFERIGNEINIREIVKNKPEK